MTGPTERALALRQVEDGDLDVFFDHQNDEAAGRMAAFISRDPADREAFDAHWRRLRGDDGVLVRTILVDDAVAGHVARFFREGKPEVTYWVGREFWGRGVATRALAAFLRDVAQERPIHACAARDNLGSLRVLQKCGFTITGKSRGFARARGQEVDEVHLTLSA